MGLFDLFVDPNSKDRHGRSPLHKAALKGDIEQFQKWLSKGSSLTDEDQDGKTPLILAVEGNHFDIWNYVHDHSKIALSSAIFRIIGYRHIKALNHLLAAKVVTRAGLLLQYLGTDDYSITVLFDTGMDPNSVFTQQTSDGNKDVVGLAPLHLAAKYNAPACIRAFVGAGATLDMLSVTEPQGSALHWAAKNGHAQCVEELLNLGAQINLANENGNTPLHWATRNKETSEAVKILLSRGADAQAVRKDGVTPLHLAERPETVELLVKAGASLGARTEQGNTPLHVAAMYAGEDVAQCMLNYGADMFARNEEGLTALGAARKKGNKQVEISLAGAGRALYEKLSMGPKLDLFQP